MAPTTNCAFRLYAWHSATVADGALDSCAGAPLGSRKRASLDKEATVAGYLGANVDRAALPAELQEDENFLLGFGEDTSLQAARHQPIVVCHTRSHTSPPCSQVVQRLFGKAGTGEEQRAEWRELMRAFKQKAKKTGTLFAGGRKGMGAGAEAAEYFSMRAYNALSATAREEHGWRCTSCPQNQRALRLFGTAVLTGNCPGADRSGRLHLHHAPMLAALCAYVILLSFVDTCRPEFCRKQAAEACLILQLSPFSTHNSDLQVAPDF